MVTSSSPEFPQKSLKIKQDDKFFTRLLSKESSVANPSFRVYYGNVSGSVPFTWEIQPGTPKHKFSDNSIPPLTPPPSYYTSNPDHHIAKNSRRRSSLLYSILMNIKLIKKGHVAASSSSPSSLSSSSWSSSSMSSHALSSKGTYWSRRRRFSSFGSSVDDGHLYGGGSPDPVKCYNKRRDGSNGSCPSAFTVVIMKKAFLSIVGRRSA